MHVMVQGRGSQESPIHHPLPTPNCLKKPKEPIELSRDLIALLLDTALKSCTRKLEIFPQRCHEQGHVCQGSCLKLRAALSLQIRASLLRIKGSKTCSHDKKCSFVHLSFGGTPHTAYLMPLQKLGSDIPCNQEPTLTQHKMCRKRKRSTK